MTAHQTFSTNDGARCFTDCAACRDERDGVTDPTPATAAETMPSVKTIDDAEFWIAVMHRRTCRDADHYVELLDRLGSADAAILQLRRIVAFLLLASAMVVAYLVVNL